MSDPVQRALRALDGWYETFEDDRDAWRGGLFDTPDGELPQAGDDAEVADDE